MPKIKQYLSVLAGFWQRNHIIIVVVALLVAGVFIVGLHDTGIVLGILTAMVIMFNLTRRWRRIRNFIFLFFATFIVIILLAFLDEGIIKPIVRFLGGDGAVNSTGFSIFNQILSLIILFFGAAGMITGLLGVIILGIWRLLSLIHKRRAETGT